MKHLSEEEIYALSQRADGSRHEHFAECEQCAAEFDQTRRLLEMTAAAARIDGPGPGYGDRVFAAIRSSLPVYGEVKPKQPKRSWWAWWRTSGGLAFAGAAACLVLLAAAFWAGRVFEQRRGGTGMETAKGNGAAGQPNRVVFVVVRDHLDRSERLLMELDHAGHLTRLDRGPLEREASDLLEDNRLYRQTAAASSDPALASLLDRLGRVLVEVAHDPSTLEGDSSTRAREQMNLDGLLFELRVLRDRQDSKETKL